MFQSIACNGLIVPLLTSLRHRTPADGIQSSDSFGLFLSPFRSNGVLHSRLIFLPSHMPVALFVTSPSPSCRFERSSQAAAPFWDEFLVPRRRKFRATRNRKPVWTATASIRLAHLACEAGNQQVADARRKAQASACEKKKCRHVVGMIFLSQDTCRSFRFGSLRF